MATSLIDIQKDVQDAVRIARFGQDSLKELKLDTITYKVLDYNGAEVDSFKGRENSEKAQLRAGALDKSNPENGPHIVQAESNIDVPEQTDFLVFVEGLKNDIQIPIEVIRNKIKTIQTAIDCEEITRIISQQVKDLMGLVKDMLADANILGGKADLTKLPSDPLKLLSWARKFVSKYLGPNLMAALDLALIIAELLKLVQDVIVAATAAVQNVLLCAASALDNAIDTVLDELTSLVKDVAPGLDGLLTNIGTIQNELSTITGKPARFNVSGGIDGLVESATVEARAAFNADMDEYLAIPLDQDPKRADDVAAAAGTMNEALGLPPLGSAVPGTVEVVIDGATFTFQNGIMVQATGTNSGTGTGISTNSQTSTSSMAGFVGAEWDGTVPAHVELITGLEAYGDVLSLPTGEIGPFATPSFLTLGTQKWYIPNNLKISSAKFSLRNDRVGFGRGSITFVDGAGFSDLWRSGLGTIDVGLVMWMSATPGGSPLTNAYGTPIVTGGAGSDQIIRFTQGYDLSLITDDGVAQVVDAKGAGQFAITGDKPHYAKSFDASNAVLLPVATKTFFFNMALVSATDMTTFITNGTVPGSSDLVQWIPDPAKTGDDYQYYLSQVPNQFRVASGGKLGDTDVSLTQFLAKTFIRQDSANTLYNGTDTTMETFIGSTWGGSYPSETQLITGWQYTSGTSVGANTDIGFVSDTPITNTARKYPIPLNGKIATSDFSVGWGGSDSVDSDFDYNYYFDRNNSSFDLTWSAPDDNLSRAWYDLDLMPVAWMSDTPGGSPKTLVDGSTGKVIKLEQTGATYKGQQLLSTTNSFGSDRTTLPIVQKTFFLNVAVVSANTATSLVASGTAPTAGQCVSWSVTDPALGYTGSSDQHLKFERSSRTTDRSDKTIPKT